MMPARAFNPQHFLESLCCSVFAVLIFHLVDSGKYLSYVTPRMGPYLYFTAIVMLIWAYAGLRRLFRPQHKIRSAHCLVLAIPILFLLLPHTPLSSSDLSAKYMGGGTFSGKSAASNAPTGTSTENPVPNSTESTDTTLPQDGSSDSLDINASDTGSASPYDEYAVSLPPGLDAKNKKITVGNDNFYPWLAEIYTNMEKYIGYQIVITGFVFKNPEIMQNNEFVSARLAMSCCVADLTPLGMICKYDRVSELKPESWVTVEGTLFKGQYMGSDEPQIMVTKITPAQEVKGYIYPY